MTSQSTRPSVYEADVEIIRSVVARAQDAQNDTDALMAMHTPEVVVVNVAGRRVLGRQAFAEAMGAALASPLSHVRTTLEVLDIRFTTPDVAIVSCVKTIHDGRTEVVTSLPATGALTYVMIRAEGSWCIALAQTTPSLAASATSA